MGNTWTTNKIRRAWLDFWKSKQHFEVPSKSLIPVNDPSLIWINSGVATLKKYFSGKENPPSPRLVNSQRAIRTNDIENVGLTSRHHTFFEMLGNFSIGDYFKKEAITWGFELLTKVFNFPLDKLYFTVYKDDQDAYDIWIKLGVDPSHIAKCDKDRNFWDVGQGPCGPCTEIYYDRGQKYDPKNRGIELFQKDIENDRYVEIWNIVFSQFNNDGHDHYSELAHKNIDTGCGLERLACVLQDTPTNFEIDIYQDIINTIKKLVDKDKYPYNPEATDSKQIAINRAYRVIADHIKACTFAVADGVIPSNTGRGYIIRRLIRRAVVYGAKDLNIGDKIVPVVVPAVITAMEDYYPYLSKQKDYIIKVLLEEEIKFKKTILKGLELFNHAAKNDIIPGDVAFKLHDTYGFLIELTVDMAKQKGVKVDLKGFKECQKQHSVVSKTNVPIKAMDVQNASLMDFKKPSIFDYDSNECDAKVIGIFDQDFNPVEHVIADKHNWIVLDKTVVYATSGGEVSDWAFLEVNGSKLKVYDTIKGPNGQHFHSIIPVKGLEIKLNDKVHVSLDLQAKAIIAATHTTEHLVQAALKKVIDVNIKQMGALKTHHKLTFDFQHPTKLTDKQLDDIEALVNKWIKQSLPVTTYQKTLEEAQAMGALAYFEEVYAKVKGKLRVIKVGDISIEICGGRHVTNTSQIEQFHILGITSKGSGSWRVEGVVTNYNTDRTIEQKNSLMLQEINLMKSEIEKTGYDNKNIINKILNIRLEKDWIKCKDNELSLRQLTREFYKDLLDFNIKNMLKKAKEIVDKQKVDVNKNINLVVLNNEDDDVFGNLPPVFGSKYPNLCFIILNQQIERISYIVCNGRTSNFTPANIIINELNNLTSGKGGGKPMYARGSCPSSNNLEKIKKFVNEKNKRD